MRLFGAEVCFAAALTCSNVNMSAVTTATSSNNSNDGSKVGLRNIVVRTAMLEEAKLLTAIINDAFDDLSFLKKDEFATRVTRDGKQGGWVPPWSVIRFTHHVTSNMNRL